MQIKERHLAICPPRPKSYSGLMELYEINYIRLRLLCGDVRSLSGQYYSRLDNHLPVSLSILDQAKHTTTLCLTYEFAGDSRLQTHENRPDLVIKIYHDARQAEVASHKCRIGQVHQTWAQGLDSVLLCRWRLNRFLYKWTAFLKRQGHSFIIDR